MAKAVVMALLPLLCCVLYCTSQGCTISQVYLPNSVWNDELFYYKQVEGIVNYGYPQGYFGFNESHALKLSFAAWSPVLVFPWVLWGLLFGWNLMSPILCNIFLMMLCCFLFVWLVKPSWKQLGILTFLFCLYTPLARYMLSGMPEVICFVMLILFYSLAINFLERKKNWKLVLLFVMSGVMTLMRPYLFLFMLLPAYFWVRKNKWKGVAGAGAVLTMVMGLYACIKHYLGAEYFAPLFFTDWVTAFFEQGLGGGIVYTLRKIHTMGRYFFLYIVEAFRSGMASGAIFAGYVAMLSVLAVQSLRDYLTLRRRRKDTAPLGAALSDAGGWNLASKLIIELHMAFSFAAMLFALLLMYKLTEGSKHLLTFISAGIFIVPLMHTRFYKKAVFLGITFYFFFSYKAVNPYDYQVPFVTEERQSSIVEWTDMLAGCMQLKGSDTPNFDNTVMWVSHDITESGAKNTTWQLLYSLPEGFGISCCMQEYVIENFDALKCQYLFIASGGVIDAMCEEANYTEICRDENVVLYKRY